MKREIRFRVWDREMHRMFEGLSLKGLWEEGCEQQLSELNDSKQLSMSSIFPYDNCEIMQFTGLKDKNGVEIYEGDLLKDPQGNIGEVFYLPGSFEIRWKRVDGSWDTDSCFGYGEVIGNIHENPELPNRSEK